MGLNHKELQHNQVYLAVEHNSQHRLRKVVYLEEWQPRLSSQHHQEAVLSVQQINRPTLLEVFSIHPTRQTKINLVQAVFLGILSQPHQLHQPEVVFLPEHNLNSQHLKREDLVSSEAPRHQLQLALNQILQQLAYFKLEKIRNLKQLKIQQLLNCSQPKTAILKIK